MKRTTILTMLAIALGIVIQQMSNGEVKKVVVK